MPKTLEEPKLETPRHATKPRRSRPETAGETGAAIHSAVINPYALAELISGRRIAWSRLPNVPRLLEDILQTPYEELFDPKYEGPLYLGLRLNADLELERVRSPLLDVTVRVDVSDLDQPLDLVAGGIRTLADLGERFRVKDVGDLEVRRWSSAGYGYLDLTVRLPEKERLQRLARVFSPEIIKTVAFDPSVQPATDWTPPNATWSDAGRFFNEAAEFFDPIQGAVANCYYIAALSAVAWAHPHRITHLTRATGQTQQQFTNMIRFYRPESGGQVDREIEVTDAVPLGASGGFIYARSSEAGEIWPAVYEKAFAKFVTAVAGDHPDITATAWGDCVLATAQLTGDTRSYYDTGSRSEDELWDLVRANSLGGRTFNPMTAWTYGTGEASEKKIVYADANIVASHCYTVLGWAYRNDRKYLIVRNPWGNTEATAGTLNDTVWLYDVSWWRPITLTTVDGTFAIEAGTFKTYFAGLGVAK
jgi:hypothetical protein